jgi:hypothetical protein
MNDDVLLGLEQIAPIQHTEPDREPPDEHSQDTQQPPFVQAPFTTAKSRPVGLLHTSQYIQVACFSQRSLPEWYVYPVGQLQGVFVGVIDGVDIEEIVAELVLVLVKELVAKLVTSDVLVTELVAVTELIGSNITGHIPQSPGQVKQSSPLLHCVSPQYSVGGGQYPQSSKQLLQVSPIVYSQYPFPQLVHLPQSLWQVVQSSSVLHVPSPQIEYIGSQGLGQSVGQDEQSSSLLQVPSPHHI